MNDKMGWNSMGLNRLHVAAAAAAFAAVTSSAGPVHSAETLRLISMLPKQIDYTAHFLAWTEQFNKENGEVVRISFIGGPEAVPSFEQHEAVRKGVADLAFGPGTYYLGAVPEVDAMVGSNMAPWERRANGGLKLLSDAHEKRINAMVLAQVGFAEFHIYITRQPVLRADGSVDFAGFKLRGGPLFREFFGSLGATFVALPPPEIYTALERGVVEGIGWPIVGIFDFGWDKHLKFRLDPSFFSSDLVVIGNRDKLNALPADARARLERGMAAYERMSYEHFKAASDKLDSEMRARGIKVVTLDAKGGDAFRTAAFNVTWERLKSRVPETYEQFRTLYYRP